MIQAIARTHREATARANQIKATVKLFTDARRSFLIVQVVTLLTVLFLITLVMLTSKLILVLLSLFM